MSKKIYLPFIEAVPVKEFPETTTLVPGNMLVEDDEGNALRIRTEVFYQMLNKFAKPLKTSDPSPTEDGWYKPTDAGTYSNAESLVAEEGYDTLFYKKGATWTPVRTKMPESIANAIFDKNNNTESATMMAIASRYDKTVNALDSFFIKDQFSIYATDTSLGWSVNGLKNDNTKVATGLLFITALNIATQGRELLDISLVRYSAPANLLDQYSCILGKKADNTIHVLLLGKVNTLPKVFEKFTINIADYVAVSICYDLVNDLTPDVYRPTITFYSSNNEKDSVKKYIDKEVKKTELNIYNELISGFKINIDDLTGANDDAKIDKAITLIENVGGGQIYFPSRQINITKAILVPSNTKIILDNCQIQMANSIHDNIFRSKGLVPNPAQYGGLCLSAEWTENFEIEGIGTPTIRQSIVPLHTGDAYGWRGVSILFVRCRNYKISNVKVIESHMWSISNEYSENGEFYNIEFSNTLYTNADGLNFRNGCRKMIARKLRGRTNDNAVATTCIDNTVPASPVAGYSGQALGFTYGDFLGAEDIYVEDVQVAAKYGPALILASSPTIKRVTYKDIVSTVSNAPNWENVMVCCNRYRNFIYGTSYVDGNISNINIINSNTSIHEYSLGIYGGRVDKIYASQIINTNPSKLGDVKNDTTTILLT